MLKTITYDRFKQTIRANTNIQEDWRITPLLNDSIRYAYEATKFWPRYLNVTPRTLSRGYVNFEEDSFFVYGAGNEDVNGLYVRNGTSNGWPVWTLYDGDTAMYDIEGDGTSQWTIATSDIAGVVYYINTTEATPPSSGWTVAGGSESPAPLLVDLPNISEVINVWTADPVNGTPSSPCKFYTDASGVRVPKATGDTVWVAYKADLNDEFGDGTGGTLSDIPQEFAEYAKYDVSYQLQFILRQSNDNGYPFAYSKVTDKLDRYLLKITDETGHRMIRDKFQTYYGTDVSVRV